MINFTGWKYYKDITGQNIGIKKQENDKTSYILLTDKNVQEWVAEGNEPLPADE